SFGIKYFLFDFVKALAISERLSERAQLYSEDKLGDSVFNLMGMISWLFKTTLYPLIALYCLKKDGRLEQESYRQVGMICMLSIYISILCLGVMILERYLHYFMIFQFLLLSYLIFSPSFYLLGRRWHYRFLGWMMAILPLFAMGFYMDYYTRVNKTGTLKIYDKYYPYTSQFDKDITPKRKKMINYQRRIR
ncbi:MAG: hypothetical protein K2G90_04450, partial [Muribaculaceae bacterium]|nr:hypothetical protein [Muribaculaceae bacterium]